MITIWRRRKRKQRRETWKERQRLRRGNFKKKKRMRRRGRWLEERYRIQLEIHSFCFLSIRYKDKDTKISSEIIWNLDICSAPCKLLHSLPSTPCSSPLLLFRSKIGCCSLGRRCCVLSPWPGSGDWEEERGSISPTCAAIPWRVYQLCGLQIDYLVL